MSESNFGKQKTAERATSQLPTKGPVAYLHSAAHLASNAKPPPDMGPDSTRLFESMRSTAALLCNLIENGKLHT